DELDRDVRRRQRKLLAVCLLERRRERAAHGVRITDDVRPVRQVHDQVEALAQEAPVGTALEARRLELEAGVAHDGPRLVLETAERRVQRAQISAIQPDPDRRDAIDARRRHQKTERGSDAGRRRTHDASETELARDMAGVDRSGATRTEQRIVSWNATALSDVHARGARHVLVYEVADTP